MTDEEIEQAVERAVANAETVRYDRAGTPSEHAEIDAEISAIERLGAFAKAAREIAAIDAKARREMADYYRILRTRQAKAAFLQGIAFALHTTRKAVVLFLEVEPPLPFVEPLPNHMGPPPEPTPIPNHVGPPPEPTPLTHESEGSGDGK